MMLVYNLGKTIDGLIGYMDSDFAGDLDKRRSLNGYVFTVGGCPGSWKASLQATIVLSTTKAEYMVISEACKKKAIWLRGLFIELCVSTFCTTISYDGHNATYLTKNQMFHDRTKRIDIRYHYIRDVTTQGDINVSKLSSHDNPTVTIPKILHVTKSQFC